MRYFLLHLGQCARYSLGDWFPQHSPCTSIPTSTSTRRKYQTKQAARGDEVKIRLKPSRKPGPRPIPRARSKSDETWGSFCPVRLTPDVHPWGSGPPITTSTAASSLVSPPLPREASIVIGLCRVHSPCPPHALPQSGVEAAEVKATPDAKTWWLGPVTVMHLKSCPVPSRWGSTSPAPIFSSHFIPLILTARSHLPP